MAKFVTGPEPMTPELVTGISFGGILTSGAQTSSTQMPLLIYDSARF